MKPTTIFSTAALVVLLGASAPAQECPHEFTWQHEDTCENGSSGPRHTD